MWPMGLDLRVGAFFVKTSRTWEGHACDTSCLGMARYQGSFKPTFDVDDFREGDNNRYDYEKHLVAENKWLDELKAKLRAKSDGDLVGETVKWSVADGYAIYIITKQRPLTLAHIETGDAYQTNGATIRGFRLQDAKAQVAADRKWQAYVDEKARTHEDFYAGLSVGDIVHYHNSFGQFVRCEVVISDIDIAGHGRLRKGDTALKPVALVGAWRSYDLHETSYHVRQIREGELCKPGAQNVYENPKAEDPRRHPDPRPMEAIVIKGQVEMFA